MKRLLKNLLATCNRWVLVASILPAASAAASGTPNLVLIFVDDMGYSDLGCYGSEIETPVLDRLAENGLRFVQFYNASRCCPSRASILTGMYPHQAGMGGMVGQMASNPNVPAYRGHLAPEVPTIAEELESLGYHTIMAGKWHLGHEEAESLPENRGFRNSYVFRQGACSFWDTTWANGHVYGMWRDGQREEPGEDFFMTDALTDYSIDAIRAVDPDKPFFLYLSHTAPHWPLHARERTIERYRGVYAGGWDPVRERRYERMVEVGLVPEGARMALRGDGTGAVPPWEEVPEAERKVLERCMEVYAAMVTELDESIGRLVEFLEQSGQLDDTVILFLSDNGASAEPEDGYRYRDFRDNQAVPGTPESFYAYGRAWAEVSNAPYRLFKRKAHEGGILTPMVVHWPSGLTGREGTLIREFPGHIIDMVPTLYELAGGNPEDLAVEGTSLVPVFRNPDKTADRLFIWEHFANRAIRKGDWKLVSQAEGAWHSARPGTWELYNLAEDPTEMNDLADRHPEIVERLSRRYQQEAERIGVVDRVREWRQP